MTPLLQPLVVLSLCIFIHSAVCSSSAGAAAHVSIQSLPAWTNGRGCMAGCLWYNGLYANNPYIGGHDLAHRLDCGGDSAINGCYCRSDLLSTASAYISSCVSDACSSLAAGVTTEISSAIALYDGYCATVTAEQVITSGTAPAATAGSLSAAAATGKAGSASESISTQQTGGPSPSSSSPDNNEKPTLGRSDMIALGVGLGIGIPSLLIALATYLQMRKRKLHRRSMLIEGR